MNTLQNKQALELSLCPLNPVLKKIVFWGHLHQNHPSKVFTKNPDTWTTFLEILAQLIWDGPEKWSWSSPKCFLLFY